MRAQTLVILSLAWCGCADGLSGPEPLASSEQALTVSQVVQLATPANTPYSTTSSKRDLVMAAESVTGNALVAWVDDRSGFPELMGQRTRGVQVPVDVGGELLSRSAVPVGGVALGWMGTQYFAAWTEPGTQTVRGRKVAPSGAPANTVSTLATAAENLIALATPRPSSVSGPRAMLLAWVPTDGGTSLMTTFIDAAGTIEAARPLRARSFGKVTQLAAAGDRDFYVAWIEARPDAGTTVVGSWVNGTTGAQLNTTRELPHVGVVEVSDPAVAVLGTTALIAWTEVSPQTGATTVGWMLDSSPSPLWNVPGELPALAATDAGFVLVTHSRLQQQLQRFDLVPPFTYAPPMVLAGAGEYSLGRPAVAPGDAPLQVAWLGQPVGSSLVIDEAVSLGAAVPTPERLSSSTARQTHPRVCMGDSRALVVWNEEQWPTLSLYFQELFDAQSDLTPFSVPVRLNSPSQLPGHADVARGVDGTFGVTYTLDSVPSMGQPTIWLTEIRDGIVVRSRVVSLPNTVTAPPAVTRTDDGFLVEWGLGSSLAMRFMFNDGGSTVPVVRGVASTPVEVDVAYAAGRPMAVWSDGANVHLDDATGSTISDPGGVIGTNPVIVPSTTVPGGFDVAFISTDMNGASVARRAIAANGTVTSGTKMSMPGAVALSISLGGVLAVQHGAGLGQVRLVDSNNRFGAVGEGSLPSLDVRADGRGVVVFQAFDRAVTANNFVLRGAGVDFTAEPDGGAADGGAADAGVADAGVAADGGTHDAGVPDAGAFDGGSADAGAGPDDGGMTADGGVTPATFDTCGCSSSGPFGAVLWGLLALLRRRRHGAGAAFSPC